MRRAVFADRAGRCGKAQRRHIVVDDADDLAAAGRRGGAGDRTERGREVFRTFDTAVITHNHGNDLAGVVRRADREVDGCSTGWPGEVEITTTGCVGRAAIDQIHSHRNRLLKHIAGTGIQGHRQRMRAHCLGNRSGTGQGQRGDIGIHDRSAERRRRDRHIHAGGRRVQVDRVAIGLIAFDQGIVEMGDAERIAGQIADAAEVGGRGDSAQICRHRRARQQAQAIAEAAVQYRRAAGRVGGDVQLHGTDRVRAFGGTDRGRQPGQHGRFVVGDVDIQRIAGGATINDGDDAVVAGVGAGERMADCRRMIAFQRPIIDRGDGDGLRVAPVTGVERGVEGAIGITTDGQLVGREADRHIHRGAGLTAQHDAVGIGRTRLADAIAATGLGDGHACRIVVGNADCDIVHQQSVELRRAAGRRSGGEGYGMRIQLIETVVDRARCNRHAGRGIGRRQGDRLRRDAETGTGIDPDLGGIESQLDGDIGRRRLVERHHESVRGRTRLGQRQRGRRHADFRRLAVDKCGAGVGDAVRIMCRRAEQELPAGHCHRAACSIIAGEYRRLQQPGFRPAAARPGEHCRQASAAIAGRRTDQQGAIVKVQAVAKLARSGAAHQGGRGAVAAAAEHHDTTTGCRGRARRTNRHPAIEDRHRVAEESARPQCRIDQRRHRREIGAGKYISRALGAVGGRRAQRDDLIVGSARGRVIRGDRPSRSAVERQSRHIQGERSAQISEVTVRIRAPDEAVLAIRTDRQHIAVQCNGVAKIAIVRRIGRSTLHLLHPMRAVKLEQVDGAGIAGGNRESVKTGRTHHQPCTRQRDRLAELVAGSAVQRGQLAVCCPHTGHAAIHVDRAGVCTLLTIASHTNRHPLVGQRGGITHRLVRAEVGLFKFGAELHFADPVSALLGQGANDARKRRARRHRHTVAEGSRRTRHRQRTRQVNRTTKAIASRERVLVDIGGVGAPIRAAEKERIHAAAQLEAGQRLVRPPGDRFVSFQCNAIAKVGMRVDGRSCMQMREVGGGIEEEMHGADIGESTVVGHRRTHHAARRAVGDTGIGIPDTDTAAECHIAFGHSRRQCVLDAPRIGTAQILSIHIHLPASNAARIAGLGGTDDQVFAVQIDRGTEVIAEISALRRHRLAPGIGTTGIAATDADQTVIGGAGIGRCNCRKVREQGHRSAELTIEFGGCRIDCGGAEAERSAGIGIAVDVRTALVRLG